MALPEDLNRELTRRLKRWGLYRRLGNDPGIGYPRMNTLKRIAKPSPGETVVAPPDWSDEEAIDVAVQVMTLLNPVPAAALEAEYRYGGRLEARVSKWNVILRQSDSERARLSTRAYQAAVSEGRNYVAGWVMAAGCKTGPLSAHKSTKVIESPGSATDRLGTGRSS